MPRLPESLAVLRLRDFRLLFSAYAVSVFGDRMVTIALAFAVLELGGSASDVGIVLACRTLPLVGSLLVGGVVADRMSRRTVMVAADLSRLASQGLLATLLIAGSPPIWGLAVLSGAICAATGFFNPASTGLMPAVIPTEQLQQANGLRATAMSGGEILGPAIAGVLIASVGPERRLDRISLAAWVWTLVAAAALGNLLWGAFNVLGPLVAQRELGGAAVWGGVMAAMGAGALAGALLAIRVRPRRPLVLSLLALTLFAAPPALLAAGVPAAVLAIGTFLAGSGMMLGTAVYESTFQRRIPARLGARSARRPRGSNHASSMLDPCA